MVHLPRLIRWPNALVSWCRQPLRSRAALAVVWLAPVIFGCTGSSDAPSRRSTKPLVGVELTLLVIDDSPVATACADLATEWKARTGASYRVVEVDLGDAQSPAIWKSADAAIYPSYLLGPLAIAGHVEPLAPETQDDEQVAAGDVFALLRTREAVWGEAVYALPCGSPSLVCYYRADLLRKFGRQPPRTWAEYLDLAQLLNDRSRFEDLAPGTEVAWSGALEPTAEDWAGLTLLARAAGYAKHPDHYSALFNIGSMEPLIAGPPFVRALEEMIELHGAEPAETKQLDPTEVRQRFWQGQCALALSWPSATANDLRDDRRYVTAQGEERPLEAGFCRLPASRDVFNPGEKQWEQRADDGSGAIPLLAVAGRLASVASSSDHKEAALSLIAALSGREWGTTVFAKSRATTLYRESQRKEVSDWVEPPVSAATATAYAALVAETNAGGDVLIALRIPGRQRYLTALSAAVVDALAGKESPEMLLRRVASRWDEITIELGSDRQRQAYQRSLGLLP